MNQLVRTDLAQVLPVVVVIFLAFLNLFLSLLFINATILDNPLDHLEELLFLVLLNLGNGIGIGDNDVPVEYAGGFLTTEGVDLGIDDWIMLNLVRNKSRCNVSRIQDSGDILHMDGAIQQIIIDFKTDGALPDRRIIKV